MANTFTFANQTLTDADIFGGINFLHDLNTGEEFSIGNTASASIKFVTDTQLPLYSKDSTNGTFTWTQDSISRGRFYITEVKKEKGKYTVTAYDAMILTDTSISALSITFPLTVSAAASAIATYIGCTTFGTINNGTLSVGSLDSTMTVRQLLHYVAEASGCSVKIDGGDHLCFMYYPSSGITITTADYVEGGLEVADYTCAKIDSVVMLNKTGAPIATAGSGTNSLYIEGNPFLDGATSTHATTILNQVKDFQYAPFTCEMFEENGLEVGTIATFGSTASLVMHVESSENGAIASAVGSDSRAEYNKSITAQIALAVESLISINTESGSIVSFSDGADYPAQDVTTTIEPIQAGTGTPSPSNPRAISGHTEVVVSRTAINICDEVFEPGTLNGTNGATVSYSGRIRSANYVPCKGGLSYYIYGGWNVAYRVFWYDHTQTFISRTGNVRNEVVTAPSNACYFKITMEGTSYGDTYRNDISLNYPSTDTSYHAYTGTDYATPLGQTVYVGTLNVTSGVLTVTHGYTTISDIGSTIGYNANGYFYGSITGKAVGNWNLISSAYKTTSGDSVGVMNDGEIKGNATTTNIYIKDSNYTDASAFKTARGSVQIVYELATPLTVNLTAQQIQILTGTNNIWSSTGNSTVKYVVGSSDMLNALSNVSANKYITQIGEDGIKVHAVNDSSYVGITSHAITMSDGTRTLYEVASTSGAVKLTRVYNAEFVQAHDDVPPSSQTDTIELGRTVDTWVSTILTYTVSGTTYTRTYNSLPISVTSGEEFTLEVSRVGTVLSVEYGMKTTGYAGDSITIDSLEFNFTTTQPVIESTIGGYADKTMSGAFRVGNGTADNALSNALLVDWTGRGMFSGDVIANCDSDSSGGVSLSSVSYEPWAWVTYNDSIPYFLSVDVARVGMLATLTVTFERPTSIASGTDLFKVSLANAPIPKPMLENSVTGATFYGNHALGLVLEFDNDLSAWVIRVRNASSSAVTVSSSVGTLTYITDGTLTKDYVPTP